MEHAVHVVREEHVVDEQRHLLLVLRMEHDDVLHEPNAQRLDVGQQGQDGVVAVEPLELVLVHLERVSDCLSQLIPALFAQRVNSFQILEPVVRFEQAQCFQAHQLFLTYAHHAELVDQ